VSIIVDHRITESSSLAISYRFPGIAYTANDEGKAVVFAIDIASGEVVGTTKLKKTTFTDPEAMAIDSDGTLWLADIGDNKKRRSELTIFAFPEHGPGEHKVRPTCYPVAYPDGRPRNAEAFLLDPTSGAKYVVTKRKKREGELFALPAELRADATNVAADLGIPMPRKVTDGAFSADGAHAVLTDGREAHVLDARTWAVVRTFPLPPVRQGESLAFHPDGTGFLIGSEGRQSPLHRVDFDQATGMARGQ
jgi:sugar lactone lactonase YvrE